MKKLGNLRNICLAVAGAVLAVFFICWWIFLSNEVKEIVLSWGVNSFLFGIFILLIVVVYILWGMCQIINENEELRLENYSLKAEIMSWRKQLLERQTTQLSVRTQELPITTESPPTSIPETSQALF